MKLYFPLKQKFGNKTPDPPISEEEQKKNVKSTRKLQKPTYKAHENFENMRTRKTKITKNTYKAHENYKNKRTKHTNITKTYVQSTESYKNIRTKHTKIAKQNNESDLRD